MLSRIQNVHVASSTQQSFAKAEGHSKWVCPSVRPAVRISFPHNDLSMSSLRSLQRDTFRASLPKVFAWDCFSGQKVKGQAHRYYK